MRKGGAVRILSNIRWPQLNLRRRAPALGLIVLYTYLAFHAFSGSQGVLSWINYSGEADDLRAKLEAVESRHDALKAQVEALSNESLDLDALDIAARRDLFVSDVKEVTIWLDP